MSVSGQGDKWIPPPPTHRVLFRHHLIFLETAEPRRTGAFVPGDHGRQRALHSLSILPKNPAPNRSSPGQGWSQAIPASASTAGHHLCYQEMLSHILQHCLCHEVDTKEVAQGCIAKAGC